MVRRLLVVLILGAVASAQGISPRFKAAGRVALDALQRADAAEGSSEIGFQQRMTIAEQQLDSAKRAATNATDKKVYAVLQLYAEGISGLRDETTEAEKATGSTRFDGVMKIRDQYSTITTVCKSEAETGIARGKVTGRCAAETDKLADVSQEAAKSFETNLAAQRRADDAERECFKQRLKNVEAGMEYKEAGDSYKGCIASKEGKGGAQ